MDRVLCPLELHLSVKSTSSATPKAQPETTDTVRLHRGMKRCPNRIESGGKNGLYLGPVVSAKKKKSAVTQTKTHHLNNGLELVAGKTFLTFNNDTNTQHQQRSRAGGGKRARPCPNRAQCFAAGIHPYAVQPTSSPELRLERQENESGIQGWGRGCIPTPWKGNRV